MGYHLKGAYRLVHGSLRARLRGGIVVPGLAALGRLQRPGDTNREAQHPPQSDHGSIGSIAGRTRQQPFCPDPSQGPKPLQPLGSQSKGRQLKVTKAIFSSGLQIAVVVLAIDADLLDPEVENAVVATPAGTIAAIVQLACSPAATGTSGSRLPLLGRPRSRMESNRPPSLKQRRCRPPGG